MEDLYRFVLRCLVRIRYNWTTCGGRWPDQLAKLMCSWSLARAANLLAALTSIILGSPAAVVAGCALTKAEFQGLDCAQLASREERAALYADYMSFKKRCACLTCMHASQACAGPHPLAPPAAALPYLGAASAPYAFLQRCYLVAPEHAKC